MKLKRRVILLSLLFITLGTNYFIQLISAGVIPIDILLYWDEECTNLVSSIDFGMLSRGESRNVTFWLKNRSTEKGRISWSSENFNPSSNGIMECWERKVGGFKYISNWHKKMKLGDLWEVRYTIEVAQDVQAGVYSWDLIVCHRRHKSSLVFSLHISCILTITL